MLGTTLYGVGQRRDVGLGDQCGFKQLQLVEPHAFAQRGDVVDGAVRELLGFEPEARERMAASEDQQRVQTCLL